MTAVLRPFVLVGLALLVAAPASTDPSKRRLGEAIDRVVERPELAHAFWGIEVRSLESGALLYERNATKAFRPASTLKLVTTAAALDAFGPDARVRTTLETAGRLDARGRLLGDVYLVGRGDASLSGRFHDGHATAPFEAMADALAAAGVHRIEGRLLGHEGVFSGDRQGLDWMREDLDWGYGAAVSALSFADNALGVTLGPGEHPGDPAVLTVAPSSSRFRVESQVLTGGAGEEEDVTLRRLTGPGPVVAVLSGAVPGNSGEEWEGEVAVEDPALFAVTVLSEVLQARGVSVAGGVGTTSEPLPSGLRVVAAHEGAPLSRLVEEVNKESQNLHAELLLRRLGAQANGPGTTESGLDAVAEFLDRLSVPRSGWGLKDGSGLSHTNLVTPRGLVALLVAMDRHPSAAVFHASLPVAGRDGNLERRMGGTPAEGRVEAKPGTLQGVNALAGHATTPGGERLAFVVIVNDHAHLSALAREAIDAVVLALATAR